MRRIKKSEAPSFIGMRVVFVGYDLRFTGSLDGELAAGDVVELTSFLGNIDNTQMWNVSRGDGVMDTLVRTEIRLLNPGEKTEPVQEFVYEI